MRIMITNDDGIHAPGLKVMEELAAQLSDDVWVVAPEGEQSGAGHSLTLAHPLRMRKMGPRRFAVAGTPTDCVMLGLHKALEGPEPDLLLSGVNMGGNLAEDVTYSGTVAGAMEGSLAGIPSIALSQVIDRNHDGDHFAPARQHGVDVIQRLLKEGWPGADVLINVNFPPASKGPVKGVRTTEQGRRDVKNLDVIERKDARGQTYYWFGLGRRSAKPGHETDLKAVAEGLIAVTPLHLDLTHFATRSQFMDTLNFDF
ncbi:MAG: 5'/3'-nucleotidase SurE [Sphingomonadales bacterium]